jgi:polysaccharide deacetylase family protein (PEP-CTERM system associated)
MSDPILNTVEIEPINMLSIDVEDYFQVSAFEDISPPDKWDDFESRVVANTERILQVLESADVRATFFVLGWVAKRYPNLVRKIAAADHEVASHGYGHQRIGNLERSEFRRDIQRSKQILEDLVGCEVLGYRAPSYSISQQTPWAFDELLEAGYVYDSSIFPVKHDFYGMSDWPRFAGLAVKGGDGQWQPAESSQPSSEQQSMMELPITTLRLAGKNLPISGGGYFRLLPYVVSRWGLQRVNQVDKQPFVFYLHPWEFDPDQPRMAGAGLKSRFRHYLNLHKTESRFKRLLDDFEFVPIRNGLEL